MNNSNTPNTATQYNYQTPGGGGAVKGYNPDFSSVFATQNQNQQNFNQGQANQNDQFRNSYNAAAQALPSYQQLNNQNNAQYNVQSLAQNAANLTNQQLRLPSENFGLTQGSDTNQAQLDQMTGVQQFRLAPTVAAANNNAQVAQGLSQQATNAGIQNEAQLLSPYANTVGLQQAQTQGAYSNFGAQQQGELTALIAKMNSGVALTQTEQNNLNALQLAKINGQYAIANTAQSQKYIPLGQNQALYNSQTGAAINPTNAIGGGVSYQY